MKGHFTKIQTWRILKTLQFTGELTTTCQVDRLGEKMQKSWSAKKCFLNHGHFRVFAKWCQAHSTGLQMHCISLNLVGVNWNQSCSRYHRHVSKYYPINSCLFQILCDSWQWKSKSRHVKWTSYVPSPRVCIQKVVCVWIWPISAHTDMCMDKHKIDVHALPIFRRGTGRHVQGHTYTLYSGNFLFTNAPPQKGKRTSQCDKNSLGYSERGLLGNLRAFFRWAVSLSLWPASLPSGKPCFNLKNKIKISSRTEHLKVSQEKVCNMYNLKGRRKRLRRRRETSGKRTSAFLSSLGKAPVLSSQLLISSLLLYTKRGGFMLWVMILAEINKTREVSLWPWGPTYFALPLSSDDDLRTSPDPSGTVWLCRGSTASENTHSSQLPQQWTRRNLGGKYVYQRLMTPKDYVLAPAADSRVFFFFSPNRSHRSNYSD